MQCHQCQHELADGAKFCTQCGGPVAAAQEALSSEPVEAPVEDAAAVETAAPAPVEAATPVEVATSEPAEMRCRQCGHELADGMTFCTQCGQAVAETQEVLAPPTTEAPVQAAAPAPFVYATEPPTVVPNRAVSAMNFKSHGFRVSVGAFVLLIAVALAAVIYLRMSGSGSAPTVVASGPRGVAGLGTTAAKPSAATTENVAQPPNGAATPNAAAAPNPNGVASAPEGGDAAPYDDSDAPVTIGRHHRGGGGPVEILGTFSRGSGSGAATVYVVGCNGERFHIYEFLNRPGFRAVLPTDTAHPIGGRDFETYEDAVREACE
jgi:hypothetical protein